jgi:hypothetical protein
MLLLFFAKNINLPPPLRVMISRCISRDVILWRLIAGCLRRRLNETSLHPNLVKEQTSAMRSALIYTLTY